MKKHNAVIGCITCVALVCSAFSCGILGGLWADVCLEVDGKWVDVHHYRFECGETHFTEFNMSGSSNWSTITINCSDETHKLEFTNIERGPTFGNVISFDVKIDGEDFSYPEDKCE